MLNIITNTASMTATRALNKNQQALAQSFQRLSTGLRVNSAKDDAAGLAISNRLTAQFRGLNQAIRNVNDAAAMVQTAESAIGEQQTMLQRMRELAVQASSDTLSTSDRSAIQAESDALASEIDRISTETSYNGRTLLNGDVNSLNFQIGAFENESISFTIDRVRAFDLGAVFTASGTVTTQAIDAGGGFTLTFAATDGSASATVRDTNTTDDQLSNVDQDVSAIAKAAAINASTADHGVTAEVGSTTGTGTTAVLTATLSAGDIEINGVDIGAVTVLNDDGDSALRDAINSLTSQHGVTATLSTANELVLTADDGRNISLTNTGAAAATAIGFTVAELITGDITLKAEKDTTITTVGGNSLIGATAFASTNTSVNELNYGSVTDSTTAIGTIDDAIGQLNNRQASIGALLNRLDNASSSLAAASENVAAARGQIMDADFATETAAFSRNQILQQASVSILAQANVQGQLALSLLG